MSNPWTEIFDSLSGEDKLHNEALVLSARFLEIVQEALDEQNLSRKDLAERMGVSPSYLTQLFRGNRLLNIKAVVQMERVLDIKFQVTRKMGSVQTKGIAFPEIAPSFTMPMKQPTKQNISIAQEDVEKYDVKKLQK
jgi:transcriptional regulator with XRE-family HTH domain